MAGKIARRGVSIFIDGSQIPNSVKAIQKEYWKLIRDQREMTIGSEEYIRQTRKIAQLDGMLREHKASQSKVAKEYSKMSGAAEDFEKKSKKAFSLDSISAGINKLKGAVVGFLASFTVDKAVSEFSKLDDAQANVQKYTGLTRDEIKELNKEFDSLNTRTARIRLNELAGDAGRLGIQSRKDILDFVDAANIIDVALGEDLGADAITSIGKLSQMFGDADQMGLKQAMLSTGSAINEVAQNSNSAEPYLVDFTNRMAGVGVQADISIPKLIGYASVLDQNAQEAEKSSTALSKLIIKLYQEPAKFAQIAGLDVKEFTDLLKKDANEALLTLFDTLGKKGGLADLAPIFKELKLEGSGASATVAVLAGNIEKIRKEQKIATDAFNEGKSVINEYDVQNNTFSANLDKQKNILLGYVTDIGEKLAPMVLEGASAGNMLLKVFAEIFSILIDNKEVVLIVAGAYVAYNVALKAQIAYQATYNAIATAARLITLANAGAKAIETGNTLRAAAAQKLYYTTLEKGGIVTKAYIAVTSLLSAAKALLTGNLVVARAAMAQFNAVVAMNPLGALLTVLAAVGTAIYLYSKRTKEASELQKSQENITKKANEAYAEQETRIKILISTINNENAALSRRKQALEELKKLVPGYHAELTQEGKLINNNTEAIKKYLTQFEKQIKLKAIEEELIELAKKERQQEIVYNEALRKSTKVTRGDATVWEHLGIQNYSKNRKKELDQANADLKETQKNIASLKAEMEKSITDIDADVEETTTTDTGSGTGGGDTVQGDKSAVQRKKLQDALRVLEEQHLKDMSVLKQKYLNDDAITEDMHNQEVLKQQYDYDQARKTKLQELLKSLTDPSLRIDIAKQIADIDAKALDRQVSNMEKRRKDLEKWNEEETKKIVAAALAQVDVDQQKEEQLLAEKRAKNQISDDEYKQKLLENEKRFLEERAKIIGLTPEEKEKLNQQIDLNNGEQSINKEEVRTAALDKYGLVSLETQKEAELALIQYYEDQGILSHEEALKAKTLADQTYLDGLTSKASEVNDKIQMVGSNLTGAMTNFASAEESAVSRKYDKQIAAAEGNSRKQKKLEEEKQKELNAIKAKYADKQFAVATAMTISSTAVAAMEAYKAMAGIPVVGPALGAVAAGAAIAYGASQIAVAKEQRDAAKEGYFDGGFTGGVDPKEVRGYLPDGSPYHGMEFFANRHATANPTLAPMWNLIDEAQKHGTAGSLTKADLAKALNIPMGGYMQGGFSGTPATIYQGTSDNRYDESYDRFVDVIERLEERLNIPFTGIVKYKGDNGIEEAEKLNEKMKRNVSR